MTLAGRRVVLGVSGGIASYKACTVARRLTQAGAQVDVVLTGSGARFVRPVTFEALTGRPVLTSLWDRDRALDHIRLAREPDLIVVAPATAHTIARAALGLADDVLSAMLLAADAPVLVAPAMNDRMFAHPATQKNLATLKSRGWHVVGPTTGDLAEGPSEAPGRMVEPAEIIVVVERLLSAGGPFHGKRVLVTAGPTREPIDPVRVISNRSSGLMGCELARAAYARGAEVTLIAGPCRVPVPVGPEVVSVETTDDLVAAMAIELGRADVLIMAAAPADYRPVEIATTKQPRSGTVPSVELRPTPDVLATTADRRKPGCICVGFALESGADLERARRKMSDKSLDMIVFNRVDQDGAGMEAPDDEVVVITREGDQHLPRMSKRLVAEAILAAIAKAM